MLSGCKFGKKSRTVFAAIIWAIMTWGFNIIESPSIIGFILSLNQSRYLHIKNHSVGFFSFSSFALESFTYNDWLFEFQTFSRGHDFVVDMNPSLVTLCIERRNQDADVSSVHSCITLYEDSQMSNAKQFTKPFTKTPRQSILSFHSKPEEAFFSFRKTKPSRMLGPLNSSYPSFQANFLFHAFAHTFTEAIIECVEYSSSSSHVNGRCNDTCGVV